MRKKEQVSAKRVLIIDDDAELCEELIEALKAEGYFAECVSDPTKAEALLREGNYDIFLLDYKMPLVSGLDILKKLKADNIRQHVFIITGKPGIEQTIKEENLLDMINGVITKPIDFKTLLEKIK